MDGNVVQEERTEFDIGETDLGSTMVLTDAGWEASTYLDPGDDWVLQADGSYVAPDGLTQTFPPTAI